MNFEEKNPQKLYFLIVPSMGETKELVILPLVSALARKKNMHNSSSDKARIIKLRSKHIFSLENGSY